jgi:hypothetical protein
MGQKKCGRAGNGARFNLEHCAAALLEPELTHDNLARIDGMDGDRLNRKCESGGAKELWKEQTDP